MKSFYSLLVFLFLMLLPSSTFGQEDKRIIAKIENETLEKQLKIKAIVTNNTPTYVELNYLLISIKKGENGNLSNNKQSGKFSINPGETKSLSEINVGLENKDALKAFLYIRDEQTQKLISKDSLEINQNFFNKKISQVEKEDAFELKGLTIDDTKTKVGRDFYDMFYIQYSQIPDKSTSSIKISELPARGTSGQINIEIDDKVIYNFITNPSEDYLMEQLAYTLRYIKEYNIRKNLIKNEFIY
ncbi:curli-like amyloid fiber formation chaperone CsgH [Chryseobacterium sp. YIM B08800]|uniref:curli-like amyloid fiber formation chaperone CsgH n=1 Tax=Chryseobacterium sp. YIM B08800 TaxID=2984136 RepID=UPI00223F5816|nr:curli-like amyloid fiber formation chaperone CsgH [Chryseobacterium sp. YIM B08800]